MKPRFLATVSGLALAAGYLAAAMPAAQARVFTLTLDGYFSAADSISGTPFVAGTPFEMRGTFDTATGTLLPPAPIFSGFVAYAPSSVTLAVNGLVYNVATYGQSPTTGVSVALFDATTVFGPPGHVAAGFIQDPLADGAGIVGDWLAATPPFFASNLISTNFTAAEFFGVGFSPGACPPGQSTPDGGCNVDRVVTPIPLTLGGQSFALTLGEYDLNGPLAGGTDAAFTAVLVVPEPASAMLLGAGLLGLAMLRRRQA